MRGVANRPIAYVGSRTNFGHQFERPRARSIRCVVFTARQIPQAIGSAWVPPIKLY